MFSKRRKPPVSEMKALAEAPTAAPPVASVPEPEPVPVVEPEPPRCANVIASDARIKGSIVAVQDLEIAGIVRGDVECHARLVVAPGGEIHGQVIARELILHGLVQGDVEISGRLAIGSEGRLIGDASARAVSIEEGAVVSGSCSMGRSGATPANDEPETIFLSRIMDDDDDGGVMPIGRTAVGA
jgi:cytoskeletal protein CcmA (bactofilin family)